MNIGSMWSSQSYHVGAYGVSNFTDSTSQQAIHMKHQFTLYCYLIAVLFLLMPSLLYANDGIDDKEHRSERCTNFKKVMDLDELLNQFYSNLERDCLFVTPLSELEKAWDIEILDEDRLSKEGNFMKLVVGFSDKPYRTSSDAFYLSLSSKHPRKFTIYITNAYYFKHQTLFPNGNFPLLLPKPAQQMDREPNTFTSCIRDYDFETREHSGVYEKSKVYYWVSNDQKRMILMHSDRRASISKIEVYEEVPAYFQKMIKEQ